jgi:opacity protein-like surface antigen
MKKILLALVIIISLSSGAFAQQPQPVESKFMQITTIESVVGGGLGRSKMVITKEDGTQEEKDLENLFSMTGINFKNIKSNESSILQTLKLYTDAGWKLHATIPMTLSPGQNGSGIFMTRYLLVKEEEKK